MKKIFLCLLITIVLVFNTVAFATPELTEPTPSPTEQATPEVTVSPTPEATPTDEPDDIATPEPTLPPSQTPPFSFTVTTTDGATEIIQDVNHDPSLTFTITPNGTEDFIILGIVNNDTDYSFNKNKTVSRHSSAVSYTETVHFNVSAQDKTVSFTLIWKDFAGNQRKTSANFNIKVATPKVSIAASTEGAILPGVPFTVKYIVKNEGNVKVERVLVQDPTAAYHDNTVVFPVIDSLAPGESKEFSANIAIDGEIKLSPSVTYYFNNNEYSASGAELNLIAIDVVPTLTLSCDKFDVEYVGAMHKFNFSITNTSQVALTNVTIYDGDDESAGIVEENVTIEPGEVYLGEYFTLVEKSGYYKFKITYTYQGADGEKQQSAKTEEPLKLPNDIIFSVEKANPPTLNDSGKITFTILIENGAKVELRDVYLTEKSGLIDKIELPNVPAAKGSSVAQVRHDIEVLIPIEAAIVDFTLGYTLDGKAVTKDEIFEVIYTGTANNPATETPSATVAPTPTIDNSSDDDGSNDSGGLSAIEWFLIIFLIILFIVLIVLFIIFIIVKNKKDSKPVSAPVRRRTIDAFDDFEYDDEYDEEYDDEYDDEEYDDSIAEDEDPQTVDPALTGATTVIPRVIPTETVKLEETPEENEEPESEEMNSVTSAIFGTHTIEENQEFSTEFNDEVDDEGVKIFKGKK